MGEGGRGRDRWGREGKDTLQTVHRLLRGAVIMPYGTLQTPVITYILIDKAWRYLQAYLVKFKGTLGHRRASESLEEAPSIPGAR